MPKDLSQLAFIDVFLPEDASFAATGETVTQVEKIVQEVSAERKMPVEALSSFIDARELEKSDSVGLPVALRVSGEDAGTLRATSERVQKILRAIPLVTRVRD